MAEPGTALAAPPANPNLRLAVDNIAQQLKRPLLDRQLTYTEGRVLLSFLNEAKIQQTDFHALEVGLRSAGVLDQFYQTAHPRWGMFVRGWLEEHGVPWAIIHSHYQYDLRDSADFFAGFLAGMGVILADLPIMLAKLGKITIDGKLVEEAHKFFTSIWTLLSSNILRTLEDLAEQWQKEFDELIYKLEWFKAGAHLGRTITNIALFGKGAAKLVASLPRFVRMVPAAAKEVAAIVERTAGISIRTAEDAIAFLKAAGGALFVVPDLRFSRLLPVIVLPGELRQLLSGRSFRVFTKSGFEVIYVGSTRAKDAIVTLRSSSFGPLPNDWVPQSAAYIRQEARLVAGIRDPESLAHILKDVPDEDFDGALDALSKDPAAGLSTLSPEELHKFAETARESPEFAGTTITLNTRLLAEDFVKVAVSRREGVLSKLKLNPSAKPNAASFGTLVESDMKHFIQRWEKKYTHLTFHRSKSLTTILGPHLPSESTLDLSISVEDYVRSNPMFAAQIDYDGTNLSKVLAADGRTLLGNLKIDLFIADKFGHQGLLLDWTSFLDEAHFNKTLLYHALITQVFRNMRLPIGEMYHFSIKGHR